LGARELIWYHIKNRVHLDMQLKCWDGQFPGVVKNRWHNGGRVAHGELYRHREDEGFVQHFERYIHAPHTLPARRQQMLILVQAQYKKNVTNKHHQMLLDEVIADDCAEEIRDNIFMVICGDKHNRLIAEVYPGFEKQVLPPGTTQGCDKAMADFD
jgi:hypothetical protein